MIQNFAEFMRKEFVHDTIAWRSADKRKGLSRSADISVADVEGFPDRAGQSSRLQLPVSGSCPEKNPDFSIAFRPAFLGQKAGGYRPSGQADQPIHLGG